MRETLHFIKCTFHDVCDARLQLTDVYFYQMYLFWNLKKLFIICVCMCSIRWFLSPIFFNEIIDALLYFGVWNIPFSDCVITTSSSCSSEHSSEMKSVSTRFSIWRIYSDVMFLTYLMEVFWLLFKSYT